MPQKSRSLLDVAEREEVRGAEEEHQEGEEHQGEDQEVALATAEVAAASSREVAQGAALAAHHVVHREDEAASVVEAKLLGSLTVINTIMSWAKRRIGVAWAGDMKTSPQQWLSCIMSCVQEK